MYTSIDDVRAAGFIGFSTVQRLWADPSTIPALPGIYLILQPNDIAPIFLPKGVGGFFKQKDPNIAVDLLKGRWIKACSIMYIGKAGGAGKDATLRSRLKMYLDFGKGKPVGHYGGRLIWQLKHHPELLVAWKAMPVGDPRAEEKKLIGEFEAHFGQLPFANLQR